MHKEANEEMTRLFLEYLGPCLPREFDVLDVGSLDVNGSYKEDIESLGYSYFGCDIREGQNVDLVVKISEIGVSEIPLNACNVDHVISGSCFEHALNPFQLMQECARVLAPGGYVIINAPFIWHEHDHPYDCFRYLPRGMQALFEFAGLKHIKSYLVDHKNKSTCFGVAQKVKRPEDYELDYKYDRA